MTEHRRPRRGCFSNKIQVSNENYTQIKGIMEQKYQHAQRRAIKLKHGFGFSRPSAQFHQSTVPNKHTEPATLQTYESRNDTNRNLHKAVHAAPHSSQDSNNTIQHDTTQVPHKPEDKPPIFKQRKMTHDPRGTVEHSRGRTSENPRQRK